ncbi:Hypothetical protein AJAP_42370 (plasmid) [Amycolatopsis japonica]|uniref:Uncharacterized protein n=1 Tax=Amycolatopsis japonica TaxID=208439 RepID=A0A075VEA3_9PSEU|nr:hypothetical protein [Amycolatopsis japonica]AIG81245.1 Hypothetical protein AJAP_42370 [Amycolatopsis japonica]
MTMPTFADGSLVHQGDLNLLSTGINNLSSIVTGAPAPRNFVPHASVKQTITQQVPQLQDVLINFDVAESNPDTMWVPSVANTITIRTAGSYEVDAQFPLQTAASDIYMFLLVNGTSTSVNNVGGEDHKPGFNTNDGQILHANAFFPSLAVGSVIYMSVFHTAGSTIPTVVGRTCARLNIRRMGP